MGLCLRNGDYVPDGRGGLRRATEERVGAAARMNPLPLQEKGRAAARGLALLRAGVRIRQCQSEGGLERL